MMGRFISRTAAAAALLALAGPSCLAADNTEQVFKQVSPSVVTLQAFDEQGRQEGQGSGVIIGPGRIITNCHVVREAKSLKVVSGTTQYAARWILKDPKLDLCLLSVEGVTPPPVPVRKLAEIAVGEEVFAVGNPLGFGLSVSTGLVSRIGPFQGEQVILSSAPLSPGSSGGGLFDNAGRLLGITTSILGTGQNFNLVLPAESIATLSARGVAPPPPVVVPGPEPRWIEEAQALQNSGDWARLERYAREWRVDQPTAAVAAAYLGAALIGQGRHQEAEETLREAVRLDGDNEYVRRLLAVTLHSQGREDEAEKALASAERLFPSTDKTHALRAEWLLAKGRVNEATAEIHAAIRLTPGESAHWRLLGRAEDQLGHADEAARAYRTALRLAPSDPQLKQALAQVLARQGKVEDARVVLGQGGAVNASDGETWVALGNGELQRKRYSAAESAFRKATELAPNLPQSWNGLGVVLAETNRPADAEKAFGRVIELTPAQPAFLAETLVNRATVRNQQGNKPDALDDLFQSIKINPRIPSAYRLLGILRTENRDYRGAADSFRKVVDLGGANADDWVSLGESLEKSGDKKAALEALEKAESLDAKNVRALQAIAGFHGRNGDSQHALEYLDRALALDSASPQTWSSKGYALLRLGRLEESISALKTAVSLDPQFANSWINLGEAQLRNRNLGQAIQSLEKALELVPGAVDARLYLAESYLGTQQAKKASEQAEIILQRQPDLPEALGVLTLASLMDGNNKTASDSYRQLQIKNPAAARTLRSQALAQGLAGAQQLPE